MSQQFDNTSDQFLDGRSVCPGHALYSQGASIPSSDSWCWTHKEMPCEGCCELASEGARVARVLYPEDSGHWVYLKNWEMALSKESKIHPGIYLRRLPYWDAYLEHIRSAVQRCQESAAEQESVLKAKEKLKDELGPREFTFTYSPDWFESDEQAQSAMKIAIDRLIKYYKLEIIEFHAVGEYTGAGRSHVHAWYHLIGGRKITDKNFKRAWSRWNPRKKLGKGFEGGHHASISRVADFAGYIEKHLEEAWLVVDINANQEEVNCSSSSSRSASSSDDA